MTSQGTDRVAARKQLAAVCRTDAELERFCLDHFPQTQALFTRGMNRLEKVNLLIEREELATLTEALRAAAGQAATPPGRTVLGQARLWMIMTALVVTAVLGGLLLHARPNQDAAGEEGKPTIGAADAAQRIDAAPSLVPWKIAGLVRGPQNQPLAGIQVSLPSLGLSVLSSEHGHFELSGSSEPAEQNTSVLLRAEPLRPDQARFLPREQHVYRGSTELMMRLEGVR